MKALKMINRRNIWSKGSLFLYYFEVENLFYYNFHFDDEKSLVIFPRITFINANSQTHSFSIHGARYNVILLLHFGFSNVSSLQPSMFTGVYLTDITTRYYCNIQEQIRKKAEWQATNHWITPNLKILDKGFNFLIRERNTSECFLKSKMHWQSCLDLPDCNSPSNLHWNATPRRQGQLAVWSWPLFGSKNITHDFVAECR